MRASELKGRAVISLADAQKVGEIDNVLVDCSQNRVVGLRVKHGLFSSAQVLRAADVHSVGPDAITIANRELLVDRETAADLHPLPDLNDLSGINVVSESGTLMGSLDDVDVDVQTLAVLAYYLGGSLWEHLTQATKRFPASPGLRFGGKLLIIPETLAATLNAEKALETASAPPPATTVGGTLPDLLPAAPDAMPTPTPTPMPDLSAAPPDFSPAAPVVADAAPTPYPPPLPDLSTDSDDEKARSGSSM
jgi:uncharacterized protein YrrD